MPSFQVRSMFLVATVCLLVSTVAAQTASPVAAGPQEPGGTRRGGQGMRGFGAPQGPAPTYANLDYAPPEPTTSNGHKLDLHIPAGATRPLPVVIWTGGSAWRGDTGKNSAGGIAAQLNPVGYAVAGVSIRSSSQVLFPGQL